MRIAIIGAGNVGGTLGRRWAELGHDVAFGLRDPSAGAASVKGSDAPLPSRATIATLPDAVAHADLVLVATPWNVVPQVLRDCGALEGRLDGRIVVDATNPIAAGFQMDTGPAGESGGERVQAMVPRAHVVKAFNTTGFENMRDVRPGGPPMTMLLAGNDATAKVAVASLATAMGFDAIDAGGIVRARCLEHVALLWIALALGIGVPAQGRDLAFALRRGTTL